jgi:hypothetical protein
MELRRRAVTVTNVMAAENTERRGERNRFPPPFYGGGAERGEAKGVAAPVNILPGYRHPFRQALRACHLPRKTGEKN